jgi:hypothetical protein
MNKLTAICKEDNGKTTFVDPEKFIIAHKKLTPGTYLVTWERVYNKITNRQIRTNFGIPYTLIADALSIEWGYKVTPEEAANEVIKPNCLPIEYQKRIKKEHYKNCRLLKKNGIRIMPKFRLTTTKMTTIEQNEYYSNMQNFGTDYLNINIPDPDPKKAKDYIENARI